MKNIHQKTVRNRGQAVYDGCFFVILWFAKPSGYGPVSPPGMHQRPDNKHTGLSMQHAMFRQNDFAKSDGTAVDANRLPVNPLGFIARQE
jgi:hypothetical protein